MKIISRTRILLIAAALPLIAAPALAETAPPAADAMSACAKAFMSSNFERERRYSVVTVDGSQFDPKATAYRVSLTAMGKESGRKLAKATCLVDREGITLSAR